MWLMCSIVGPVLVIQAVRLGSCLARILFTSRPGSGSGLSQTGQCLISVLNLFVFGGVGQCFAWMIRLR